MEKETRGIYRAGTTAFEGIAPEYHIALRDRPIMVWDVHSQLPAIQMMCSFLPVAEASTLKLFPDCYKAFFAGSQDDVYCSLECNVEHC